MKYIFAIYWGLLLIFCHSLLAEEKSEFLHIYNIENVKLIKEKVKAAYGGKNPKPTSIGIIGDSYVDGNYYAYRLYTHLTKKANYGGLGFISFAYPSTSKSYSIDFGQVPLSKSFVSPIYFDLHTDGQAYGPDARHVDLAKNSNIELTPRTAHTSIDIFYLERPDGGTFSVTVANKKVSQSTLGDKEEMKKLSVEISANKKITITVDEGRVLFAGCNLRNDIANSFRVHKMGYSGACAIHFAESTGRWVESAKLLELDAATISFGVNDSLWVKMDNYDNSMRKIASNLRAANPNIDLIFIFPAKTTGAFEYYLTPLDYEEMRKTMKSIADDFNGAFIDMNELIEVQGGIVIGEKELSTDNKYQVKIHSEIERIVQAKYLHTDRTHPNVLGKIAIFDSIRYLLEE